MYTPLASDAALPRAPARTGGGDEVAHLLQVRGRQPAGQPQAEHRRRAGVLQQAARGGRGSRPRRARASGAARSRSRASSIGLECKVYMVRISYDQKPFRRSMIQTWGAEIVASPSPDTRAAARSSRSIPTRPAASASRSRRRSRTPRNATTRRTRSAACSTTCSCTRRSSARRRSRRWSMAGAFPDVVIGCVGGGSNFAGLAFPFIREKIAGRDIDVLACEPAACPTLTRGLFAYDFGDTSKLTPLVAMHTLGHDFVPAPIHAGGLRYHGVAPLISQLVKDGLIRAEAYLQSDVFASAVRFANTRGDHPRARVVARDPRRARGRAAGRRGGRGADDPLQPLRPRSLRHGRVRQLLGRQARGRRARRGRDRARAARDRRSAGARVDLRAPAEPIANYGRLMLVIVNGSFGVPPPSLSSCPFRTSSFEPSWSSS